MPFAIAESDVARISAVLGVEAKRDGNLVRFEVNHEQTGRHIVLEILTGLDLADHDQPLSLVSVYGTNSFQQIQGCTGFIASQELGEVIFFAKNNGVTSGLVIEREAACSLYANVDDRLLSADFTQLPPEVIMSSVALSMTESLFNDLG